jgi:hypothetical protein
VLANRTAPIGKKARPPNLNRREHSSGTQAWFRSQRVPDDYWREPEIYALPEEGQPLRMRSATALTDCATLRIEKKANDRSASSGTRIVRAVRGVSIGAEHPLRRRPGGSAFQFTKRGWLGSLLLLAYIAKVAVPETVVAKISQELFAKMIGTRARGSVSL